MAGGEIDRIKTRIKKAATVLADDDSPTSEGKHDQAAKPLKGKLQQAVDQMKAAVAANRGSRWAR
jgi:uncharacterized protein YjbJ (UPF0337 family)